MKPHLGTFSVCLILVLVATGLEIWRPIIIGDAIDEFITGQTSRTVLSSGRTEWAAGEMADARFQGVLIASARYLLALVGLFLCNRFQFLMMQKMGQDIWNVFDVDGNGTMSEEEFLLYVGDLHKRCVSYKLCCALIYL